MKTYAPYQQRVIDEKLALDLKIDSLKDFINDDDQKIFDRLPADDQFRLARQLLTMESYSDILGQRIAAFGEPDYTPPALTKTAAVATSKTFRQGLDKILQEMKAFTGTLRAACNGEAQNVAEDPGEAIAQHIISTRDLESAIMRQGMVLKNIGNPDPYPQSRNPESPVVEPTADGLKL
jgi:hypothetical protein